MQKGAQFSRSKKYVFSSDLIFLSFGISSQAFVNLITRRFSHIVPLTRSEHTALRYLREFFPSDLSPSGQYVSSKMLFGLVFEVAFAQKLRSAMCFSK